MEENKLTYDKLLKEKLYMEMLLNEICDSASKLLVDVEGHAYMGTNKGPGSKSYTVDRIKILRQKLLQIEKQIKSLY